MAGFISWFQANWATFIGTIGAIIGACFTVAAFRQTAEKADRDEYAHLADQHQVLWKEAREREDLVRICQPQADLEAKPLTIVERLFLNEVFVYFETGWNLARRNTILEMETYTTDVQNFFSLPLPRAAWEQSEGGRNKKFVRFVEKALRQRKVAAS